VEEIKKDPLKFAREAIDSQMKSQRRPGDPPAEVPGASIEANFKPYQIVVDGQPGTRPIDSLLSNINELYNQLVLAAQNPAQAKQALDQVEVEIASLRANATRLPPPIKGWIDTIAKDAAVYVTASSLAQLRDGLTQNVTGPCQQIIQNRYPFAKSDRDVPMADFAKLFSPGGTIDRFFSAYLEPLVNHSGKIWVWKPNPNLTSKLSDTTLRHFQQAAEIRDAFFPTGGNAPNLGMEVKPLTLSGDAQTATLSINGATVVAQQGPSNAPANIQWPGAGAGEASIAMAPDLPDRPSKLERTGAWALFRLIDVGSPIQSGNVLTVSFVVFGRYVSYEFTSSSLTNPLNMPSLRQFGCPNGL
jgi:type VI secretion system protein ImpL